MISEQVHLPGVEDMLGMHVISAGNGPEPHSRIRLHAATLRHLRHLRHRTK